MSDPVTNIEIEDVLSSIRRLVSDGDKARTRDPGPVDAAEVVPEMADKAAPTHTESPDVIAKVEKLVLTPAFLVVDSDVQAPIDEAADGFVDEPIDEPADEFMVEDDTNDHVESEQPVADDMSDTTTLDDDVDDAPLRLSEMVWDTADKPEQALAVDTTDRSELVATIAELEAAISTDTDEYEPDGSEEMAETIAWPGSISRQFGNVEAAEPVEAVEEMADDAVNEVAEDTVEAVEEDASEASDDSVTTFAAPEPETETLAEAEAEPDAEPEVKSTEDDVYSDDDLDGLLEAGGVQLDEGALRAMVSDVVREELTGPLGERITRNVRKLVRREIYRILSSQEFD